jgi:hydroxymethylpyrimidine pyrophosphatase-like HAD family hydrolase
MTLPELARLAVPELDRESWLDGFLLVAGISQLIDDFLQPDPLSLRRTTAFLAKDGGSVGRAVAVGLTGPVANGVDRLIGVGPTAVRVRRLHEVVATGLQRLADLAIDPLSAMGRTASLSELKDCLAMLSASPTRLPQSLRDDIVRLPTCFRNFDQHPDDLRRLVEDFSAARPDRLRPIVVVGVRTSGSYLAPLYAAHLRAEGFAEVDAITMRPGRRVSGGERARLRSCASRGGLVLLCDDPPATGGSLARVAAELQGMGIPEHGIVLVLALFAEAEDLPPALSQYDSVLLRFDDWSIHRRIGPDAVREAADHFVGPDHAVVAAERVDRRDPASGRRHLKAVYRLTVSDVHTGISGDEYIAVEGVGLGYFGNHALAVAEPLRDFLPRVLGVRDGLLFRSWLPDTARADLLPVRDRAAAASRIAEYIFTRNRVLGVTRDVTVRQSGQYPAWEAASTLVSRPFGPIWPIGRTVITDRLVKRLLRAGHPSVTDPRVELSEWFAEGDPGTMVKVDWDQGSSSNLGLGCCDPIFDLAAVTAESQDTAFAGDLRRAYEELQGGPTDDERWLLYQLALLSARLDGRRTGRQDLLRASSRAMQNYFRRVYFDDLILNDEGPLCGIDIDGVLEAEYLGFPALTPASASGLRSLLAHGYRPLIATGRSLGDVIDRCQAYRLVGGVAEYGSVTYEARNQRVTVLTPVDEQTALERLRSELRGRDRIELDEHYTHAIRAFVRDGRGVRGPVPSDEIEDARRIAAAEQVSAIVGYRQTDLIGGSVVKGLGVRALTTSLAGHDTSGSETPLAFAVGDTISDVSLLGLAEQPFAPSHGRDELSAHCTVTRSPYQAGFAEAVGHLIGHAPGECPTCRLETPSRDRRLLLALFGLRERGMRQLPMSALKLAAAASMPASRT